MPSSNVATLVDFKAVAERMRATVAMVAAGDPDPANPYRGVFIGDNLALSLGSDRPELSFEERFDLVCERLALDDLDRAVLAVCSAPEVHPDFGRMFGYLHDDLARCSASPRLAARLLAGDGVTDADVMRSFDDAAPLCRSGAVRVTGDGPLADRLVNVGGAIAAYLLGSNLSDAMRHDVLRRVDRSVLPTGRTETTERIALALAGPRALPLAVSGPDADLLVAAAAAGPGLVVLEARATSDRAALADLALTAALEQRVPMIDRLSELPLEGRAQALDRILTLACRPVLHIQHRNDALVLADRPVIHVRVPAASLAQSTAAWRAASRSLDVGDVPERFRLDLTRIQEAVVLARAEGAARGTAMLDPELLAIGARGASSRRVGELAELLRTGVTWSDLVMPDRALTGLHSIVSFLVHRDRVMGEWGYDRMTSGVGLTALFAGESGTGKTLAARVIAAAAGLDVYRVDLAGIFSKWVGETEKNLDRVFDAAEGSNAVLFFDEADVVFGKRSEIKSSHDRYANLETAYLLQRIESFDGVVLLATNLRSNIDSAFIRRLQVIIEFPAPDVDIRQRLWRALLPSAVPLADDVDLSFLATSFELSGGNIRNCTLAAAFMAAADGGEINMVHLVRAVALEFAKLGRLTLQADFKDFYGVVRQPVAVP
jgi:AAA+ superfamily predicted ATPase